MSHKFEQRFYRWACVDDKITTTLPNGIKATARIEYDETHEPPWESGDGYGIVSDWRSLDSKRPGERILVSSNSSARFYDVEATMEKAREEDWGCGREEHDHKTKGETIACAVQQDYELHKAWCDDRWYYVGVVIDLETENGWEKTDAAALWGIEGGDVPDYDAGAYLTDAANELLEEVEGITP